MTLIIVESPTKAKTLSRFLGGDYRIEASMGHIRDLPASKLGIDLEHDFKPEYVVAKEKQARVTELQKIASSASEIILATDPDREGEAISWHVASLLSDMSKSKSKSKTVIKGDTQEEQKIIDLLMSEPLDFDELRRRTDFSSANLESMLSVMQIKNKIQSDGATYRL